jgi:guanylate kinase
VILVLSGPGGAGKGTLVARLLERDPRWWVSRSWTTRSPRAGEPHDAYHFATREEFLDHVARGGFLEWVEFLDYLQGSPVPDAPEGRDVIFEIDVHGARQVLEHYPEAVWVFVDTPDPSVQEERLRARGDDPERIAQRLAKAAEERDLARELGVRVVVNDDLERALAELESIVADARHRGR